MSAALIWRLVWKDFRILLPIWLAVFGMAVGMQVVSAIGAAVDGQWNDDLGLMLGIVAICLFPFPIAAGAIQFAGETEEGTADWLRQLPISSWLLAALKLLTPLLACALYVVAASLTALLFSRFRWSDAPDLSTVGEWGGPYLYLFATSAFFSIQIKKVVPAAALGLFCGAFLIVQVFIWIGPTAEMESPAPIILYLTVALLAIDFALAVRWARGKSVRPSLRRLFQSTSLDLPNARQPALAWSIARRDPVVRSTLTLAWKELRSIAYFLVMWGLVGWAAVHWFGMRIWDLNGVSVAYILLTPMIAGLFAYMGDHSREMQLFFGERGVSPALIWFTRNTLWFSAAIVLVLGWSLWDRYALHSNEGPLQAETYLHRSVLGILDEVRVHYPATRPYRPFTTEDALLQASFAGSLLLGFFALGGMCGMWIRRPVVATSAAVVGGSLLYGWHWLALKAAVPLWLTTWPLAILWLAATWCGCDRWLTARTHLGRQSAWMFLPGVLVLAMFPIARYHQIPNVDVSLDEIEARWMDYNPEQSRIWEGLEDDTVEYYLKYPKESPWSEADSLAFTEHLHNVASKEPLGQWKLSPETWFLSGETRVLILQFAERRGAELREQGRLAEEFDLYSDALLLLDRVEPLWPSEIWSRRFHQLRLFTFITDWANQPEQSPELLRHAFDFFNDEYRIVRPIGFTLMTTANENYAAALRQVMRQEGVMYESLLQHPFLIREVTFSDSEQFTRPEAWLRHVYDWSGETARYEKLLAAIVADARLSEFERRYRGAIVHEDERPTVPFGREDLDRWLRATPVLLRAEDHQRLMPLEDVVRRNRESSLPPREELPASGSGEESKREIRLLDDEREIFTAYYLTVLTVALQRHRHEHGALPEHLSQLEGFHPQMLELATTDPFSGNDFHWYPHGLPGPLFLDDRVISARRPLLFSVGRDQRFLQFESLAHWLEDWIDSEDSTRGAYRDGTYESSKRFYDSVQPRPEPPLVPSILNYPEGPPEVVATAVLGESAWPSHLQQRWRSPEGEADNQEP